MPGVERRSYARFPVENQIILIYVDNREYTGVIKDVCEEGFRLEVPDTEFESNIKFSYQFSYNKSHEDTVNGEGRIVRVKGEELGCRVRSNEELISFVQTVIARNILSKS